MRLFGYDSSSDAGTDTPPTGLFEDFFGHRNTSKPETPGSSNNQENPLTEGVKIGFDYLSRVEDGSESDPSLAIWLYESLSGTELPSMARALLNGTTISKHGDRVKISRDGEVRLDLNQELLGGKIKIQSLNFGDTGFDLSGDVDNPRLKNIGGLSLAMEIGGSNLTINVKDMVLKRAGDGELALRVEIEHPVPLRTRLALGLPASIPLTLVLGSDGMPEGMRTSDALNSAADALGYGIAGLTFGNRLRQAAREAKFAEEHRDSTSGLAENLLPELLLRDSTFEQSIHTTLHILKTLPDGFEFDPRPVLAGYESFTGQPLAETAGALLHGVTKISKNGGRIEIGRDGQTSIPVNMELIGGAFKVKSINLGSTGFDLTSNAEGPQLGNITGLTLSAEIAGMERTIAIKDVALRKGTDGKLMLDTELENPVPTFLRSGLRLPLTERIPVSLVLNADGQVEGMTIRDALNTAAEMIGAPQLWAAAKAADIVERHPELAKGMLKSALPIPALVLLGEDDPPDLAELALRANPVYATYKTIDFVAENRDEVLDVAGDVAQLAFKASPAGMAYSLFFGD